MNPVILAETLAVLVGMTAAGACAVRFFGGDLARRERLAWSMACGTILLAAASVGLMKVGLAPGPKKLAAVLVAVAAGSLLARRPGRTAPRRPEGESLLAEILFLLALLAVGLFAVESARGGMWSGEHVAIWGLKAKTIFTTASIPARLFHDQALAGSHPEYPLLVPLTTSSLAAALRAWDPHALALLDPFFALATVLLVSGFLARRVSKLAGGAGGLLVALCAPLYAPGNVGTAEIPMAFGFVLAGTAFLDVLEHETAGACTRLLLASLFCAAVKPEGLVWVLVLLLVLVARPLTGRPVPRAGVLSVLAALGIAFAASWWIRGGGPPWPLPQVSSLAELAARVRGAVPRIVAVEAAGAALALAALGILFLVSRAGAGDPLVAPILIQVCCGAVLSALPGTEPLWRAESGFGRGVLLLFPTIVLVVSARAFALLAPSSERVERGRSSVMAAVPLGLLLLALAVVPEALRAVVGEGRMSRLAVARPTFHASVEPILQAHCQTCHRPGGIAPFPLVSYEDASSQSRGIRKQVSARHMPPWKAREGCQVFSNDPSLSETQIATLVRWVDAGSPEGNPKDAPPPRKFPDGWELGTPDLVLKAPAFTPDFSKGDLYQCFVLPTNLDANAWVSAVEVKPGNRGMVHHALLYVEEGIASRDRDAEAPGPGYPCFGGARVPVTDSFGEWAPGMQARFYPPGVARFLPRKSRIIMQVHYSQLFGSVAPDESEVGVYFAKGPIERRLLSNDVRADAPFTIPAGAVSHTLSGKLGPLDARAELVAILPHMHLLGRTMKVVARFPDGSEHCLVDVADWDMRWQRTYFYKTPVILPKGTVLELSATFDNSYANPDNPSEPHVDVHFGEHTTDEMCMALLFWTVDGKNPGEKDAFFRGAVCGVPGRVTPTPVPTPAAR